MRKILILFIFIFLTGLFAGLFFSMRLSVENNSHLSELLLTGLQTPSVSISQSAFASLFANFLLLLLMVPALFTRFFCPLPVLILLFKGFSIGFCSGLLYLSVPEAAFRLSLIGIFPQNLFFIPAFITLSSIIFYWSFMETGKKNRPRPNRKGQQHAALLALAAILAGCITEAVCHAAAL